MIRLVSADDVKDLICRYVNGSLQHTMVYEIEKLDGTISTQEQMLEILGNSELEFEENEDERNSNHKISIKFSGTK